MIKTTLSLLVFCTSLVLGQNTENRFASNLKDVTLFFQGAQLQHQASVSVKAGKQTVIFEKLTDHIDLNSIQVKALGPVTILSVSLHKNYEDKRISNAEIKRLNDQVKLLDKKEKNLRDENDILQIDRAILNQNSDLKGESTGLNIANLKEAYTFIHARMIEISKRESEIYEELEVLLKKKNGLLQEINVQRDLPIITYSEIVVEVDAKQSAKVEFHFNYLTPEASWQAYYDMRSQGIGSSVSLEAKALVRQNTGIDWKDVNLLLSTNDPYQSANEKELLPWKLDYNRYPYIQEPVSVNSNPSYDYAGQTIRGEVIDAKTGESLPFAKLSFIYNKQLTAMSDADGKFEIQVPQGETYLNATFVGYHSERLRINGPYLKFFMKDQGVHLAKKNWRDQDRRADVMDSESALEPVYYMDEVQQDLKYSASAERKLSAKKSKKKGERSLEGEEYASNLEVQSIKKDLRIEYQIQTKFSVTGDGKEQRVSISDYDLNASYEYHTAPKIDPGVYLVAQVSGWEGLNLLNGESNIYFDGTYIGKSYIDAESIRDTLSFSFGKDAKIQTERKRMVEKSKNRTIGSRQKYEVAWELTLKNNGGAQIPLILKDQFPVSVNNDIKVKWGDYPEAKLNELTGILTWKKELAKGQSVKLNFDYSVEYQKGSVIYLE